MNEACVFCNIVAGTAPATVVFEDVATIAFLPLPEGRLAEGHLLVIPKRHVADVFEATAEDMSAVGATVQRVSQALRRAIRASGVNLLNASGPHSDQSVFHLHFHVVPRWQGDGLWTWPAGRSAHPVPGDYVTELRRALARDIPRR
jgi:histidine triad (HIT) family protein